ncbi:hypothetical protein LSTR_LSTR009257 [Laodelphax striatellus]|uniref:Uncharacterized protein n=1 Tax=Laodelphax striatellus TaxID=195883 RepID=A0A482WYF2_LAOST|nr:hypothetical protein LSTR_LSTR009257 [Laodelphax striatellus]
MERAPEGCSKGVMSGRDSGSEKRILPSRVKARDRVDASAHHGLRSVPNLTGVRPFFRYAFDDCDSECGLES